MQIDLFILVYTITNVSECRPPNVVSLCFVVRLMFHVYPAYPFVSNNIQKQNKQNFMLGSAGTNRCVDNYYILYQQMVESFGNYKKKHIPRPLKDNIYKGQCMHD